MLARIVLFWLCLAVPARACDLALVLAVDVSGSVSPEEYEIQRRGLADALRDDVIAEALVRAEARLLVLQWTGQSRQRVTIPWTTIDGFEALERFAAAVAEDPRVWRHYSTAIGEALMVALRAFEAVPACQRRVIDVSGDGRSNEGISPRGLRPALAAADVTVNALVIEGAQPDLGAYFRREVITGPGAFAVSANSHFDYPERIREKLLREVVLQMSRRDAGSEDR